MKVKITVVVLVACIASLLSGCMTRSKSLKIYEYDPSVRFELENAELEAQSEIVALEREDQLKNLKILQERRRALLLQDRSMGSKDIQKELEGTYLLLSRLLSKEKQIEADLLEAEKNEEILEAIASEPAAPAPKPEVKPE